MGKLEVFDWVVITVLAALLLSKLVTWKLPKLGKKQRREEVEKKMVDNKD